MSKNLWIYEAKGTDPYRNLACEQALMGQVSESGVILYLWQNHDTVVIGRNQNPWLECRTAQMEEDGVKLARRLSGGGAVFHDLGNLNFTFITPEKEHDVIKQMSVVQKACQYAGIDALLSGRNDLTAQGKKFSGNAFSHRKGVACHHGTLLINSDLERLSRYLSPPQAKLQAKGIASVRSRVDNLSSLSPSLTCEAMKEHLIKAFGEVCGGEVQALCPGHSFYQEIAENEQTLKSESWLWGAPMPFSCELSGLLPFGFLHLQLQVEKGIILDARAYSDTLDPHLPPLLCDTLTGVPLQAQPITDALKKSFSPDNAQILFDFIKEQCL